MIFPCKKRVPSLSGALWLALTTVIFIFSQRSALATTVQTITVKMMVLAPACNINGGQPINVDFGKDVLIDKIDGSYKKTPLDYTLKCSSAEATFRMKLEGKPASFDQSLLLTSNDALGVRFLKDGDVMPVNSSGSFTMPAVPRLEAVLVKDDSTQLNPGPFTATATLMIDYN